ncbi:MAG: hypothetical protein LBT23_03575 [Synergistaceae bacterium]|jgi:hypothetical protein|nr:hypothetical protein [Synergistaceae bacterium]
MSVCVVAVISTASLIKLLALAGAMAAGSAILGRQIEKKEERDAVRRNVMMEIASESDRISSFDDAAASSALMGELDAIRSSLDSKLSDAKSSKGVYEEINALVVRIREAELDDKQCRARSDDVRAKIEALYLTSDTSSDKSYKTELEALEKKLDDVRRIPFEERMSELQGILDRLEELERLCREAFATGLRETGFAAAPTPRRNDTEADIRGIRDLAGRIAMLDEEEGEKIAPTVAKLNAGTNFPDRLAALHRQMKTTWGKLRERAALSAFFRDTLTALRNDLSVSRAAISSKEGSALMSRCDALRGGKYIDREEFMNLYEDMARFVASNEEEIADSIFAHKVKNTLAELGYELITDELPGETSETDQSLEPGAVRYFDTPYDDYRVMLKVDERKGVTTRLVRAAEDEDTSSEDDVKRDVETGKKWCADLDAFLKKMSDDGLPLDVTLRQEPGEVPVLKVTDLAARRKKKSRKRSRTGGKDALKSAEYGGDTE